MLKYSLACIQTLDSFFKDRGPVLPRVSPHTHTHTQPTTRQPQCGVVLLPQAPVWGALLVWDCDFDLSPLALALHPHTNPQTHTQHTHTHTHTLQTDMET